MHSWIWGKTKKTHKVKRWHRKWGLNSKTFFHSFWQDFTSVCKQTCMGKAYCAHAPDRP